MRVLFAAALAAMGSAAVADPLYKCSVDGTVTYSSEKCKGKTLGEITAPDPRKVNPNAAANLERDKAMGAQMEKERLAREAANDKIAAAGNNEPLSVLTPTQRRCARMRLDKKIADDKQLAARESDRDQLRQDAQRKGELLASECPG